jgi:hypothetical protein
MLTKVNRVTRADSATTPMNMTMQSELVLKHARYADLGTAKIGASIETLIPEGAVRLRGGTLRPYSNGTYDVYDITPNDPSSFRDIEVRRLAHEGTVATIVMPNVTNAYLAMDRNNDGKIDYAQFVDMDAIPGREIRIYDNDFNGVVDKMVKQEDGATWEFLDTDQDGVADSVTRL